MNLESMSDKVKQEAQRRYPNQPHQTANTFNHNSSSRAAFISGASYATQNYQGVLGNDDPFPLKDVLYRLVVAAEYLLKNSSYDGPDYEELGICVLRAKETIRLINSPSQSPTTEAEGKDVGKMKIAQISYWLIKLSEDKRVGEKYSFDEVVELIARHEQSRTALSPSSES